MDRIKNIKITGNSFKLPEDFDGESFFADSYGIIIDGEIEAEKVVIRVSGNQERYIRSLPLHHSQKEEEITPDYTIFSYRIKPTFDFRRELLSYRADMEQYVNPLLPHSSIRFMIFQ